MPADSGSGEDSGGETQVDVEGGLTRLQRLPKNIVSFQGASVHGLLDLALWHDGPGLMTMALRMSTCVGNKSAAQQRSGLVCDWHLCDWRMQWRCKFPVSNLGITSSDAAHRSHLMPHHVCIIRCFGSGSELSAKGLGLEATRHRRRLDLHPIAWPPWLQIEQRCMTLCRNVLSIFTENDDVHGQV